MFFSGPRQSPSPLYFVVETDVKITIVLLSNQARIAFVNYEKKEDARAAIKKFNQMSVNKRVLTVKRAYMKSSR